MYPHSVVLRAAVLTLHDALPSLPLDYHLAILEVPSYHIVYSSLFSDISGLSLMCGVLARFAALTDRLATQLGADSVARLAQVQAGPRIERAPNSITGRPVADTLRRAIYVGFLDRLQRVPYERM